MVGLALLLHLSLQVQLQVLDFVDVKTTLECEFQSSLFTLVQLDLHLVLREEFLVEVIDMSFRSNRGGRHHF